MKKMIMVLLALVIWIMMIGTVMAQNDNPKVIVQKFYSWYIKNYETYQENFWQQQEVFEPYLYEQLIAAFKLDPIKDGKYLDFDPFSHSQIGAYGFSVGEEQITGNNATIPVNVEVSMSRKYALTGKYSKSPLKVFLCQSTGGWKITNFIYKDFDLLSILKKLNSSKLEVPATPTSQEVIIRDSIPYINQWYDIPAGKYMSKGWDLRNNICGACSLAMALGYYEGGRKYSSEEVMEIFASIKVYSGENTQTDIDKAVLYLESKGYKCEIAWNGPTWEQIVKQIKKGIPVPVSTKLSKYGHWVLIVGYNDETKELIVNDPAGNQYKKYWNQKGEKVRYPFGYKDLGKRWGLLIKTEKPVSIATTITASARLATLTFLKYSIFVVFNLRDREWVMRKIDDYIGSRLPNPAKTTGDQVDVIIDKSEKEIMQKLASFCFMVPKKTAIDVLEILPLPRGWPSRSPAVLLKIQNQAGQVGYAALGYWGKNIQITNITNDEVAWKLKDLQFWSVTVHSVGPEASREDAEVFLKFVRNFPNSKFVPEALFYAGENYWYAAGSYLVINLPNHRASDECLKKVKEILNDLVDRFPDSDWASKGREILEKINRGEFDPNVEQLKKR